jgi:hypothetical protein
MPIVTPSQGVSHSGSDFLRWNAFPALQASIQANL